MIPKKKILVFIDWFEPAYKAGGPITSVSNLLRGLSGKFDFYILTGCRDYGSDSPLDVPQFDEWLEFEKGISVCYSTRKGPLVVLKAIRQIQPSVIYINGIYSPQFSIIPLIISRFCKQTTVLSPRGMLAPGAIGIKPKKKKLSLWLLKKLGFFRGVVFHATDASEGDNVRRRIYSHANVQVISNIATIHDSGNAITKLPGILNLIFVGRIAPEKNLHYAINILLTVQNPECRIEMDVVGEVHNQAYLDRALELVAGLPENITVNIVGAMKPEKLITHINKAHAIFLPTLGENFGHAIVECLSLGKVAIISDKTPWRKLSENKAGFDIPLDKPLDFVSALNYFCKLNQDEFKPWSDGAAEYVKNTINTKKSLAAYEAFFNEMPVKE